nr:probable disease resistance protein At4g27220 [Quercus suber]
MREIVTNEGEGEAGDEICFNQLNYLYLEDLPSLRSFDLGNHTIKFPSLEDLVVTGCLEMKIFSNGVLSMPKLKRIGLDENEWWPMRRELLPEEDVNSAIKGFWEENYDPCVQQLFTEKDIFPDLEELKLEQGFDEPSDKLNGFSSLRAQGLECVQQKVEAAQRNVEEIEAKVQRWLTSVEEITAETRYELGRRAHELGLVVKDIKDKGTFQTVGHRVHIQGGTTNSTKGYEDFESRKIIFDGVMKALKDDNICAIGVCGMGGLGKTMLVGKVATQVIEDKLFKSIVTVVVSHAPDLKKIQKDIAKELGLSFQDEETDSQKANLLRERLKKEKILLIIDDIWNKIDLEDLGISFGNDHKGSKLLLTSRFRDVLATDMDAQEIFSVGVLLNDEAKYFFSKIVGDLAENLNFQSTMVEVVKECAGLPIAITTVANTLKNQKNPNVWKDALRQLKRANPTQIKGMHEKVYSSIKFSYNFLSKEAQSLFLFCSSFEEDMVIKIDLLWRYLTLEPNKVRNMVHTLVESLKDSCLLLEGYESGTFKMHDVIRDVAIYINLQTLVLLKCESEDLALIGELKNLKALVLLKSEIKQLPMGIRQLTHLQLLDLRKCTKLEAIPSNVLSNLKILEEIHMNRSFNQWQVDGEITERSNARVLRLVRYEILIGPDWDWDSNSHVEFEISRRLKIDLDRSFQEEDGIKILLKSCEYLTLAPGKGIKNILYEVDKEGFPRLKHLYVQNSVEIQYIIDSIWFQCVAFPVLELLSLVNMINLEKICHNQLAMGSFHNLRKLEIRKCDNLIFVFSSALLGCFSQLQEIEIEDCKVMSAIVAKERKHGIQVNDDIITDTIDFTQLRSLNLKRLPNLMGFCSNVDSQPLFNKKPNILRRLQNLEDLQIRNCNLVEEVFEVEGKNVDEICDMVVPTRFKVLKLINVPNLKHVWSSGPQAILTFQNLHEIEVSNCKSMKSLFPASVAKSLEQLERLKIHNYGLEEIVAMEEGSETVNKFVFPRLVSLSLELMPDLKYFYLEKHTLEWPSLKQLTIHKCDKVKIVALNELSFLDTDGLGHHVPAQQPFFLFEKVVFSNMEDICINAIDNLKILWHNHQLVPDSFCKLKKLRVGRCKNLMNIFLPNMLRSLQNLEELEIRDCNSVEEVFDIRGVNIDEICTVSNKLRVLMLFNLLKLKHVWSSDLQAILTFQNLREVEVSNCRSLKSLFPFSVAKSLEQLNWLTIQNCGLEEIVAMEEGSETMTKFVFPRITYLRLQSLPKLKCFYPGKHTSKWPSLERLRIYNCDKVKNFASNELSFSDTDGLGHHVPVQQPLFLIEKVGFPNLEDIYINDMDNLKMLWHNHQLVPDSFCKLKELHVSRCKNLINIFLPNMLRRLQNLEELEIRDCNSVEEVFDMRRVNVDEICDTVSTRLRVLRLFNLLNLEHVWSSDRQAILTFQNLGEVEVSNCKSLKSFFPILVAKSCEQLESLTIGDCGLEEIVAMEGVETTIKLLFP